MQLHLLLTTITYVSIEKTTRKAAEENNKNNKVNDRKERDKVRLMAPIVIRVRLKVSLLLSPRDLLESINNNLSFYRLCP